MGDTLLYLRSFAAIKGGRQAFENWLCTCVDFCLKTKRSSNALNRIEAFRCPRRIFQVPARNTHHIPILDVLLDVQVFKLGAVALTKC